jgi:hypothetical protein
LAESWLSSARRAILFLFILTASLAFADGAAFDLSGPPVNVRVRRGETILPIAEVPNLQPADRLWIQPDLPETQSARYIMIIAFLRGTTNPPPENWFTKVETWNKQVREEGFWITVPNEATQALVFFAPETGGGFSTLRAAVRGKPGAFVRAVQDLHQASLDRMRLEKYLASVRLTAEGEPEQLHQRTEMLARSLNMKVDQQCFDKPSAQQAPCLTQNTDQLVLDDAHTQTMMATLTTGASADLLSQVGGTPMAKSGYYSPYIGAVIDMARILGTAHTAQYQYIPALSLPHKEALNLRLNNPPSFRNPKSVIVVGFPPIAAPVPPPLRAADPKAAPCIANPDLVLSIDGAPLVFATELSHDLVLRVPTKAGKTIDLPAKADPERGGLVIDTHQLHLSDLDVSITATLRGQWGFQSFEGPRFQLRSPSPAKWTIASKETSALIVGRQDTLHLESPDACCVNGVKIKNAAGHDLGTSWKLAKPGQLEVQIQLQDEPAGLLSMSIEKFGLPEPDAIPLHTYAEAGRLDSFTIHAGDSEGILRGTRLDGVTGLELGELRFLPHALTRVNQQDELRLVIEKAPAPKLQPDAALSASVTLKDGRTLPVKAAIDPPRPKLQLMSKVVQPNTTATASLLHVDNPQELPQDARLNFSLKTQFPEAFPVGEKIEIAATDESFHTALSIADGNLILQDAHTVLGILDPLRQLGPSAFGPLKFRAIGADGVEGDWQPLVNLVRVPVLKEVRCSSSDQPCTLVGDKLFLLDSVSTDPDFATPTPVPDGFADTSLPIPGPVGKAIYVRLRDDPATIDAVALPLITAPPQNDAAAR